MKKGSIAGALTIISAISSIVGAILDYVDEKRKEKRLCELELKVARLEAIRDLSDKVIIDDPNEEGGDEE